MVPTSGVEPATNRLTRRSRNNARSRDRATWPPAALSLPAIQIAAVARRLGMIVAAQPKFATYQVPFEIRDAPGPRGPIGRLSTDLLGRDLLAV
jgi:hypothetical protein